jgi:hypothetical protein
VDGTRNMDVFSLHKPNDGAFFQRVSGFFPVLLAPTDGA